MFATAALIFLGFSVTLAGIALVRFLTQADRRDIVRKVESDGGKVIWLKRLQTEYEAPFNRWGPIRSYDVLVERGGVRRIEVWRHEIGGAFKDY